MEDSYLFTNSIDDLSSDSSYKKGNLSICDQLDFEKLRISALTKAAEISPHIKEVTIGPSSPMKETPTENDNKKKDKFPDILEDSKLRDEQRHSIIFKEHEVRLQEMSAELFTGLLKNLLEKRNEVMKDYFTKQCEKCDRKAIEIRTRELQMLKELSENDNLSILEKAKLDEKNVYNVNKQTIENMNRILEEQNKATARFASVTDSHTKICICYKDIIDIVQSEPSAKEICEKYNTLINKIMGNINVIMDMCKTGSITDEEVKQSEVYSLHIDNIKRKIIEELNASKQLELRRKQEEDIARIKEQEDKKTQVEQAKKRTKPLFYSHKNYNYYENLKSFLEQYESQYKDVLENNNLKKFRFDCQKAVNTPINALSSVSGNHMRDKFYKLSKLLKGERVQVLDTYVSATQHPQGLYYCTALLARKIVRQGDLLVSSNPEAAFPLAAVTVALWSQFPEFGKLVEAYFHKECPYLVPMFLPQKEGQTDKAFYMSRGYKYSDDGVVEKQDKFLKRMSGIFQLHCAIWITKTPKFLNTVNSHSLQYAWQWLASFINLKPEPDICATLLYDFFTVCGAECLRYYKKQFIKIIRLISTKYLVILQNIDEGGPKTRLEVFLHNVLKDGTIPPPNGLLSPNIW